MSSFILIHYYLYIYCNTKIIKNSYLLLTHPFIPKAPVRTLDLIIEYSTLDLASPLNIEADNPLKEESTFLKPPFQLSLNTDLAAINRLDNLPLASTLTPANLKCFKCLST